MVAFPLSLLTCTSLKCTIFITLITIIYNHIDYKEQWIDSTKLARHILGFANSGGGIIKPVTGEDQFEAWFKMYGNLGTDKRNAMGKGIGYTV